VKARLEGLRAEAHGLGAGAFLVTRPVNIRYLSGFESSNAALVVGRDRVVLATDGRYVEAARALEGIEVVQAERDLLAVKDENELAAIRRAARVTDAAYERLAQEQLVGRTEAEVAWWLEQVLHDEGADALAFPVIVAAGPNAALPHHHPGGRKIGVGETVIVDSGAQVHGYCSDCTRTFATGALPDSLRRAYALCHSAQESARVAVRSGADASELDAIARTRVEESALAPVLHGLGHGVGLEVHEQPILRPDSPDTLVAGNVVTVEPGVYLAGEGGVRIEDLVVVGDGGPEVLSSFTRDLLTLD
jgi:Xaa-Pro aminopeptidase